MGASAFLRVSQVFLYDDRQNDKENHALESPRHSPFPITYHLIPEGWVYETELQR